MFLELFSGKGFLFSRTVDINECNTGRHCANGECINVAGGFQCKCTVPGTTLDPSGNACVGRLYAFMHFY